MTNEVDLPINDTKNDQVRIFEKIEIQPNQKPKLDSLMKSKILIDGIYSESAHQELSKSVKKSLFNT